MFSYLCVVKCYHIVGEDAACEDELFASVSQYCSDLWLSRLLVVTQVQRDKLFSKPTPHCQMVVISTHF
jgi:hypothetical protein